VAVPADTASDRAAFSLIAAVSVGVLAVVGALVLGGGAGSGGVSALPAVNALLNGTSASLLTVGWLFVRGGRPRAHRAFMLAAFGVSILFLVSYVVYHSLAGSRPFTGQGWIRPVYFALLLSHIVLAAVIVPLVLLTLYRAWRGDLGRHRRIARWTLPIWLYVSVTGVIVYWMLYHSS
jgi:putative membrane protein